MLKRILIPLILASNISVCLWAQAQGSHVASSFSTSSTLPVAPVAPAQTSPLRSWLTPILGGAAGGFIGAEGISYAGVDPSTLTMHRIRAGVTYGLMGAATSSAVMLKLSSPEPIEPHRFWLGPVSTSLLAGIGAVQVLDYTGTRHFRNNGHDEWLLTNGLVDNRTAFIATEASAVASAISLAYILHRSGHHRAERWFEAGYIAVGVASTFRNYSLSNSGPFTGGLTVTPQGRIF